MVFKNCDKQVPQDVGPFTVEDETLLESARSLRERAAPHVATQALHKYADELVQMVWETNKYIDVMEPWSLKKTDTGRMATVLYVIMEVLRHVAILYQPIIPGSANKILDLLCVPEDERTFAHLTEEYRIREGAAISMPSAVFPRIEVEQEVPVV
jgi:methionyl-tRNA synthetase